MFSMNVVKMNTTNDWRGNVCSVRDKLMYSLTNENISHQDVVIVAGCGSNEKKIKAHSLMLYIGSQVLETLLEQGKINNEGMKEIKLPDVQPEAMKIVLQYIYTDWFNMQHEDTMDTLYASIKFNLHDLSALCVAKLMNEISTANVLRIFDGSVKMNMEDLIQTSQEFILKNAQEVFMQDQFMNIAIESLCKLLSFDELEMDEISIFNLVVSWGEAECVRRELEASPKNLRFVLKEVVPFIRFTLMAIDEFARIVVPTNILNHQMANDVYTYLSTRFSPGNQTELPLWILSSSERKQTLEDKRTSSTSSNIDVINQTETGTRNLPQRMSPSNATKDNLLQYLKNISGKQTISGLFSESKFADCCKGVGCIHRIAGVHPGILTLTMPGYLDGVAVWQSFAEKIISYWNNGYLVYIVWWNNEHPLTHLEIFKTRDESKWEDLLNEDGNLNREWKKRLDAYVPYLKQIQDAGVVVICDIVPWINCKGLVSRGGPGMSGSVNLYQITHDYMTQKLGLHSLLWAWCFDISGDLTYLEEFWPGDSYVDVVSAYIWESRVRMDLYDRLLKLVGDKPISMEYVCTVPSPADLLALQPRWTWFTTPEAVLQDDAYNSNSLVKETFQSPLIINKENIEFFKKPKP